jgi:hypothetical protein
MTEFAQELRHMCRNPRCRMKLPAPTANLREAFCTRGCYESFHLKRCRVCDGPIEQPKHGTRLICKKSKCKNAWKAGLGFGRFAESSQASSNSNPAQEVPANQSILSESKPVERAYKPWRQIAGPPLTPNQFHCATLGGDAMDEVLRVEAKNRAALQANGQAEIEAIGYFTEPEWREVISLDGVKCFVTRFRDDASPKRHASPSLLRRPPQDHKRKDAA